MNIPGSWDDPAKIQCGNPRIPKLLWVREQCKQAAPRILHPTTLVRENPRKKIQPGVKSQNIQKVRTGADMNGGGREDGKLAETKNAAVYRFHKVHGTATSKRATREEHPPTDGLRDQVKIEPLQGVQHLRGDRRSGNTPRAAIGTGQEIQRQLHDANVKAQQEADTGV